MGEYVETPETVETKECLQRHQIVYALGTGMVDGSDEELMAQSMLLQYFRGSRLSYKAMARTLEYLSVRLAEEDKEA